jgi:hypothetical protein
MMNKNLRKHGVTGLVFLILELLTFGCAGTPDAANTSKNGATTIDFNIPTGADFSTVIFPGEPFEDSFTEEFPAHFYRMDIPEDVIAVDIYTTGTANRLTVLSEAGVGALMDQKEPPMSEVLGINYTNSSLGVRTTVPVPENKKIFIWIQAADNKKTGNYTIMTKTNLPYPAPFEGVWRFSQSNQQMQFFLGFFEESWQIRVNAELLAQGTYTYTDDKITFTITEHYDSDTKQQITLPATYPYPIRPFETGAKYLADYTLSGNNLNVGPLETGSVGFDKAYPWIRSGQ